uniref:Uncharacterized protein n=1 Tax=Arundo donax TaxID=35708 RepID=A0A0A9CDQ8_ARUDO
MTSYWGLVVVKLCFFSQVMALTIFKHLDGPRDYHIIQLLNAYQG